MVGGGTPGPCRAAGDLPLSPELFQSFGPILNRSRAAGSGREKDSVYRDYTNFQEPERQADLSVCLSVCERPVDARNGPVNAKLVCRCSAVGLVFVVGLILRLPPLSAPFLSLRFPMKKKKCISLFFFVENVEN